MSMKHIKQVLKSDDDIQVAIARAIVSVQRDVQTNPKQFAQLYELVKKNAAFEGQAKSVFVNSQKSIDAIMAAAPTTDREELERKCRTAGVFLAFIAGMQLGAQVAAEAFTDSFDDAGVPLPRPDPTTIALIEEQVALLRDERPADNETPMGYVERVAKEVFTDWKPRLSIAPIPPPTAPGQPPADMSDLNKLAKKIAENFMGEQEGISGGGPRGCGCRDSFRELASPESLEVVVSNMARDFPGVLSDSIHAAATRLGLKGVSSAQDIAKLPNGRGELTAELARHPLIREMTHRALIVSAKMTQHGGDITQDDTLDVLSTCLASLLGYALTDMTTPSPNAA